MSTFEQRHAARVDRLRRRAAAKRAAGDAAQRSADAIAHAIPLGQPVLVGHHSEKRHRRDLDRMERGYRRAIEGHREADELERRASAAEANTAIFSDDPAAADKLRAKIAGLEQQREKYKAINRAVRSKAPRDKLRALGLGEQTIEGLLTKDAMGDVGIPAYTLANLSANLRRLRERLSTLEAEAARPDAPSEQIGEVTLEESDNRVRLIFPSKPDEATRKLLRSRGFRWSPTAGAWQRHANEQARYAARFVAESLRGAP